jgi:hypothetical protein
MRPNARSPSLSALALPSPDVSRRSKRGRRIRTLYFLYSEKNVKIYF